LMEWQMSGGDAADKRATEPEGHLTETEEISDDLVRMTQEESEEDLAEETEEEIEERKHENVSGKSSKDTK
jgi:putative ABC transport system ATP-binding protein